MKWVGDGKALLTIRVIKCSWQFVQMGKPKDRWINWRVSWGRCMDGRTLICCASVCCTRR